MTLHQLQPGDIIYAASDILNDGTLPELPEGAMVAKRDTRGVLVNVGHLEENPERELYLVRFEDTDGQLGLATACWPEELRAAREDEL